MKPMLLAYLSQFPCYPSQETNVDLSAPLALGWARAICPFRRIDSGFRRGCS